MEKYTINKIEGFNPYDHIEVAKDRHGEDIIKKDGTPLKYLSTAAKVFWFRKVYPNGLLKTELIESPKQEYGYIVKYRASVLVDGNVLSEVDHQETVWDIAEMDAVVSKVQTIARGKALSLAGFGCEIECALGIASEGEEEKEEKEETPKKKKNLKQTKNSTSEEADLEAEVENLMNAVENSVAEEKESANENNEEDVNSKIDEYLKMSLETTEKAPINIKKMEGMLLSDILRDHKDFGNLVKRRPNIRKGISDKCAEALIFIEENR